MEPPERSHHSRVLHDLPSRANRLCSELARSHLVDRTARPPRLEMPVAVWSRASPGCHPYRQFVLTGKSRNWRQRPGLLPEIGNPLSLRSGCSLARAVRRSPRFPSRARAAIGVLRFGLPYRDALTSTSALAPRYGDELDGKQLENRHLLCSMFQSEPNCGNKEIRMAEQCKTVPKSCAPWPILKSVTPNESRELGSRFFAIRGKHSQSVTSSAS